MANRRRSVGRGPTAIFKKRFSSFSKVVTNTTPVVVSKITLAETATIYAVKVSLIGLGLSTTAEDVQEVRLFVECVEGPNVAVPDPLVVGDDPDFVEHVEIDPMNGFYLGSLFVRGNAGGTQDQRMEVPSWISEKFRFRRKCDRRSEIRIIADSIVRAQAAQSVVVSGGMQIVTRVR